MKKILQVQVIGDSFATTTRITRYDAEEPFFEKLYNFYCDSLSRQNESPARSAVHFWREYNPAEIKDALTLFVKTLNSGDAPVPRIENDDVGYILVRDALTVENCGNEARVPLSIADVLALNDVYRGKAEIYTPKKYEANWKRLFPREVHMADIETSERYLSGSIGAIQAINLINQLLQTEANGLEVHELIVYEV